MKKFAPRNGATRASRQRGANRALEKSAGPTAGESELSGRELCEDFAPRNGGIRPSGERGANRPTKSTANLRFPAGNCVKILLPETEP